MFSWVQDRYFVITTEKIYNVKKSKIKRSIVVRDPQIYKSVLDKRSQRDHKDTQGYQE